MLFEITCKSHVFSPMFLLQASATLPMCLCSFHCVHIASSAIAFHQFGFAFAPPMPNFLVSSLCFSCVKITLWVFFLMEFEDYKLDIFGGPLPTLFFICVTMVKKIKQLLFHYDDYLNA